MADPMHWEDATKATIDRDAYYIVQTNGGEWRDFDQAVISGLMVSRRIQPHYVRGRPVWVAKITPRPETPAQPNPEPKGAK